MTHKHKIVSYNSRAFCKTCGKNYTLPGTYGSYRKSAKGTHETVKKKTQNSSYLNDDLMFGYGGGGMGKKKKTKSSSYLEDDLMFGYGEGMHESGGSYGW